MSIEFPRLNRIVVYSAHDWESVLPILRIVSPVEQAGIQVIRGNEKEDIAVERVSAADAVVIQRNFPRYGKACEEIFARAHAENKPILFELDDLLLELPEQNPARAMPDYKYAEASVLRAIVEADAVTASTSALCDYLRPLNANTWLLPDYLEDRLWTMRKVQSKGSPVIIGYIGGHTHVADLEIVVPVLHDILKRYGNSVSVKFWGCEPPLDYANLPNVEWIPLNLVSYSEFALYCSKLECDILIAPLRDNLFNRCKSPVKFLEYSALGVPAVFSHITPYATVVSHGQNGFLASTPEEWHAYLVQLIESPELRQRMGQDAQQTVHDRWLLSQHAEEWRQVYEKAIAAANDSARKSVLAHFAHLAQSWQREIETELHQKEETVVTLSGQLGERAQVIHELERRLEAEIDQREQVVATLSGQIEERGLLILGLERQLTETQQRAQELGVQVAENEKAIVGLNAQLADITNSTGWALLQVLWRIRLLIAPHGSRREQFLRWGMQRLRSFRNGLRARSPESQTETFNQNRIANAHPIKRWLWQVYAAARPTVRKTFPDSLRKHIRESFRRYAGPEPGKPTLLAPLAPISKPDSALFGSPAGYDVIFFPIIDWEHRFQRPQQLASLFAQNGHRVFYLNLTFHELGAEPMVRQVADQIFQVQLPGPQDIDRYFAPMSETVISSSLKAFESLSLQATLTDAICMVEIPFWSDLALRLREQYGWKVIYDCMDEQVGLTILNSDLIPREAHLAQKADLVLVSSQYLFEKHAGQAVKLIMLRNAADFQHFNQQVGDRPLDHIAHPIIGYYGAIMDWFDSKLLSKVASARPDWNFILIGNVDTAVGALQQLPNVQFLGEQLYARLPAYVQQFDVCLIPFKLTPIIQATNPVKFYEYLSAGKPVVSTPLPELAALTDLYYPAKDANEFIAQIEKALDDDSPMEQTKRIGWASEQTWQSRYELLISAIDDLYGLASIIIVSYNSCEKIRACLESIARKTFYPRYEIIIVDNGSTTDVLEYLQQAERQDTHVRVIPNGENLGFARAVNVGLNAMSQDSEYIVLLNNDTVVTPGWLGGLVRWLRDPAIGLVGPVTCPSGAGNEAAIPVGYTNMDELDPFAIFYAAQHRGNAFDIPMLAMYCLGMRRQVYEEIGLLDEQFETGMFEDDDYSLRAKNKGYRVVCAEDVFIHHDGRSSFSLLDEPKYQSIFNENRRRFEEKWGTEWKIHTGRQP